MHDGHIRPYRRHGGQTFAGEGAFDELDLVVDAGQLAAYIAAQHGQRQPSGAGLEGTRHGGVAVFENLDLVRPAFFDGIAQAVQRPDPRIAAPGEDHLPSATGTDQLVIDQIRRHADQRQIALALTDDLVSGSEGNQMGEAFHGHGSAVFDVACHRIMQLRISA